MSYIAGGPDDPTDGDTLWELSRRVTILVSYDPESDTLILDRGKIPRVMADGIVHRIDEGEFSWADQLGVPVAEEVEADDD